MKEPLATQAVCMKAFVFPRLYAHSSRSLLRRHPKCVKDKLHELDLSPAKFDDDICDIFLDSEDKVRTLYYTVHKMDDMGAVSTLCMWEFGRTPRRTPRILHLIDFILATC